jgi:hypothetical protein
MEMARKVTPSIKFYKTYNMARKSERTLSIFGRQKL